MFLVILVAFKHSPWSPLLSILFTEEGCEGMWCIRLQWFSLELWSFKFFIWKSFKNHIIWGSCPINTEEDRIPRAYPTVVNDLPHILLENFYSDKSVYQHSLSHARMPTIGQFWELRSAYVECIFRLSSQVKFLPMSGSWRQSSSHIFFFFI